MKHKTYLLIHWVDIKYCQSKDKKILLSMGGATPAYGLSTIKEGEILADELWDTFGAGYTRNASAFRPFGTATVDGFDLDIENGEKVGYTSFVNRMRQNYGKMNHHTCIY
jgi:chitinase